MKRQLGIAGVMSILAFSLATGADSGNLRYSISVAKFDNEAGWSGQWEIGSAFGEIMTDALQQSKKFIVLGEKDMRQEAMGEQDLATSGRTAGGKKAPKTGQMTPAQLLVKGAVTHVQDSTTGGGAGVSLFGFRVGGSTDRTEVNVTIYIIDSTTGQVKASTKVVGKAGRKGLDVGYSGSVVGANLAGFKKNNVGKACEDAVAQAVDFLTKQLEKIPWEGTVIKAGDKIIINRGSREGVSVDQVFNVGSVENLTDNDTGEVLDSEMKQVGKIKVTSVKEKIAYCEALEGQKKIDKNMTVQPAD
ncbi:MAG: CsgG/HfaB family protein [Verrucomicrobia bacterium]|nr:CsgG/HfaB family protein [Verrucomicrobiota bacterium]MCG2679788.1 CsgG/HfaB family protein [Kiritimatiellia bacterium]MBU4247107.1 CsgG/HfaB family protein [Verrucomicrobiota bacterium]MBU4289993.1 CsgG/HfaB family protein [Verrucomicrobiota bacterium]MBU4428656.1 CsgG/HfaB family protein [Verrucomicrobiota bacterium]